jgi:hypothetical protein
LHGSACPTLRRLQVEGEAAKITRGVPTVGRLPNRAIIEREVEFTLATLGQLRLTLSNPDFTPAKRIAIAASFRRFGRGPLPPAAQKCRPAGKNCRAPRGGGADTAHRPRAL